jgi:hypothetical protein
MRKITFLFMFLVLNCINAAAQIQPMSNLTIFSDDGAKFYLILNGEKYNNVAETNVRIEELPNPYYDCKIVFEDKNIPVISKNALMLTDVDGNVGDVTYRIKKDKKGKYSLKFYSNIPIQPDMPRPANCAVYQYGHPNQMLVGSDGHVYETVTVQTTSTGGTMGVNMNVGGLGVSMTVPADEITTTTTTTTTTTSSGSSYNISPRPVNGDYTQHQSGNHGCRQAMNMRDFEDAKKAISDNSFEDTKLSTAEQVISANCLNTTQITALIKLFSFEETKLEFAKKAYDRCVDKNNYYKVGSALTFESSKTELNEYLQSRR